MNKGLVGKYGEWFTVSTSWTYDADDLTDNVAGHIYYIQQTEIGTKVSLDHFTLELPSEKSLPAAHDPCNELVVNGDAENTDGNGFSYYPSEKVSGSCSIVQER